MMEGYVTNPTREQYAGMMAPTEGPRPPVAEELDQLAKVTEFLGCQIQQLRERLTLVLAVHPVGGSTMREKNPSAHCPLHGTLEGLRQSLERHCDSLKEMLAAVEV